LSKILCNARTILKTLIWDKKGGLPIINQIFGNMISCNLFLANMMWDLNPFSPLKYLKNVTLKKERILGASIYT
jgi:hypothetical protein